MIKKKFFTKNTCLNKRWSRQYDSTRKKKCRFGLDRCFPFCRLSSKLHCAYFGNKTWLFRHFWAWHIIPYLLYHACIICIVIHLVKYLMPNLFLKVKKYGRPFGSSDQRHREYSRRMQAWHPKGEGTSGQVDKSIRRPHQNTNGASSRPITFATSVGPQIIRPHYELFAT